MTRNSPPDLTQGVASPRVRAEGLGDLLGSPFAGLPGAAAEAASRLCARGPAIQQALGRGAAFRDWPGLTRSLTLFVPGAGHLLRGETQLGLCFLALAGFLGTLAWAVTETFDRLVGLLRVLGYPSAIAFGTLAGVYGLGALLHLGSVLSSIDSPGRAGGEPGYHPLLPATASAVMPGWGQLLNGDRLRAGTFLVGLWLAGGVWLGLSPAVTALLDAHMPAVTALEEAAREPGLLWLLQFTLPVLLWTVGTYDAAVSAFHRRR
jgi:hypothetical protein